MNLRKTDRIDYKLFHETGLRVLKKMDDIRVKELKIREDVEYNLDVFNPSDLETVDEVDLALTNVSEVGKLFRHINVELKGELGDEAYEKEYKPSMDLLEKLKIFHKDARKRLRDLKKENEDKNALDQEKSRSADSRYKLHNTMNGLLAKMNHLNDTSVEIFDSKIQGIDEYIVKMEKLISQFLVSLVTVKAACGEDAEFECSSYLGVASFMSEDILMAKKLKLKLCEIISQNSGDVSK